MVIDQYHENLLEGKDKYSLDSTNTIDSDSSPVPSLCVYQFSPTTITLKNIVSWTTGEFSSDTLLP